MESDPCSKTAPQMVEVNLFCLILPALPLNQPRSLTQVRGRNLLLRDQGLGHETSVLWEE